MQAAPFREPDAAHLVSDMYYALSEEILIKEGAHVVAVSVFGDICYDQTTREFALAPLLVGLQVGV